MLKARRAPLDGPHSPAKLSFVDIMTMRFFFVILLLFGLGSCSVPFAMPQSIDLKNIQHDSRWGGNAAYLEQMFGRIQQEWRRILAESRVTPPRGSHVTVTFTLNANGETDIVKVEDAGAGKQGVFSCQNAITYSQPYHRWTDEMKASLGESQELTITFYYQ
jgi:hypothetical protein